MNNDFLPISKKEMNNLGWDYYDFLFISGDAYVDHPSFGTSLLARLLESNGYRVCMCPQPDRNDPVALTSYGEPRLGVLISGGVIDSMVNHYTASKKRRSNDVYSPGGKAGYRPDRCVIVYSNMARAALGNIPVIIGGTEASLRRFAHYDYWQDKVRRSILIDSGADLLLFGMGERSLLQVAEKLRDGIPIGHITNVKGSCFISEKVPKNSVVLPSFEKVESDKESYARAAAMQYYEQDSIRGKTLVQQHGEKYLVQLPLSEPLSQKEMDKVYALNYMRAWHPSYDKDGGIPALEEVKFSITSSRGCFGSCSFCALTFHQGRVVQARSQASILAEAQKLIWDKDFKGYIHDVGGPTANFRAPACKKQLKSGTCRDRQCLYPSVCPNAEVDHKDYLELLRKLRALPKVKKVFIRSGIRYDYLIADKDDSFFRELCEHHVSGQLKVAPEHISDNVLRYMGKPGIKQYEKFQRKFYDINKEIGKEQYLVPYLMSSHPGSTLKDAIELAVYLRRNNIRPEQVQDFYPTPGTLSTAMFYTGLDPRTMKKVYVPRSPHEKALQRALLQSSRKENYKLVHEALTLAGRTDLIGFGPDCLIKPERRNTNVSTDIKRKGALSKNKRGASQSSSTVKGKRHQSGTRRSNSR